MSEWGIVAALLVAALIALLFVPLRVRFSLQGRGEPNGTWAVAGGAQLGPLAGSAVAAFTLPLTLSLHLFGRKLWQKTARELSEERRRKKAEEDDVELAIRQRAELAIESARQRYRRLERWFDPLDLALFVVRERRRIRFELVIVDLDYSFVDIALTGKVLAAIYAISPLLPGEIVVRQTPSWESVDKVAFKSSGSIRVWPGLLFADAVWYLIRNVRVRRPKRAAPPATEPT